VFCCVSFHNPEKIRSGLCGFAVSCAVGIWIAFAPGAAFAQAGACSDAKVVINGSPDTDLAAFETEFRKALDKACTWWGKTFGGPFAIDLDESRGPSMALVPAWRGNRGEMLFRAPTVREGRNATTHEIVHVLAPNANRFLAEGLAVYAHEHLGGTRAYPNFGKDLHQSVSGSANADDIVALERITTPSRLENSRWDGKAAYLVAGSFVRFLFETHGEERFRRLYAMTPLVPGSRDAGDPGRWRAVYGVGLDTLAVEWRAKVAR